MPEAHFYFICGFTGHMQVVFVINGAKRTARKLVLSLEKARPAGYSFQFVFTTRSGDGAGLSEQYAGHAELIVAVGGDGTLNECINGLEHFRKNNPAANMPALALLPVGSGNDFARNFSWKRSAGQFMDRLLAEMFRDVDVCKISYADGKVDFFINEASTGLSTEVVKRVARMPRRWNGNVKFGLAVLGTFLVFRKKHVTVASDTFNWSGDAMLIACSNGKYFGSGLGIAPDALLDDGFIATVVIGNVSVLDYIRYLPKLRRCQKIQHPAVHYFKGQEVSIIATGTMEKDGEPGGEARCSISVHRRLKILC